MRDVSIYLGERTLHLVRDPHDCDSCANNGAHHQIDAPPFLQTEIGRAVKGDALAFAHLRDLVMTQGLLSNTRRVIDAKVMQHVQWLLDTRRLLVIECIQARDERPLGPTATPVAEPPTPRPRPIKDLKTWIEIELIDDQGKPVPDARYSVKVPEGVIYEGTTDRNGRAKITSIDPGTCDVSFDIDAREWKGA